MRLTKKSKKDLINAQISINNVVTEINEKNEDADLIMVEECIRYAIVELQSINRRLK